jgi:hypothetical protein
VPLGEADPLIQHALRQAEIPPPRRQRLDQGGQGGVGLGLGHHITGKMAGSA